MATSPPSTFTELSQQETVSTAEALALFDSLAPVNVEFMFGRWRGAEFPTGHRMDGSLSYFNWYGKEFVDAETVNPLLFFDEQRQIFKVAPARLITKFSLKYPLPLHPISKRLFLALRPVLETKDSAARLRRVEYRGQVSATMIYDHLPINDTFKKIDDDTVLGIMDTKGMEQPFFFLLRREAKTSS
jgi:hypothetical protein